MSNVVAFRPIIDRHASGWAKCLACKHRWAAVAPIPVTDEMECPSCGLGRGVYEWPFDAPEGDAIWTCACGNELVKLVVNRSGAERLLCVGCGNSKPVTS